jgi:hypothetical protein
MKLLGAFATKAVVNFIVSLGLSARVEQRGSHGNIVVKFIIGRFC